jgi:hypothetical protein
VIVVILVLVALIAAAEAWRLWVSYQGRSAYFKAAIMQDEIHVELGRTDWVALGHHWSSDGKRQLFGVEFQDRESYEREHRR